MINKQTPVTEEQIVFDQQKIKLHHINELPNRL